VSGDAQRPTAFNPWSAPPEPEHDRPGYAEAIGVSAFGVAPPARTLTRPRSLRGLGLTTAGLLAVQAVLGVVGAIVGAWGVLAWSRVSGAPADLRLVPDTAQALVTAVRAPLAVLTGITFVAWVWVATANLRSAGARVRHAPGWALGGWLVPVLNLWRPKQMVDDLWRASTPGVPLGVDLRLVRRPVVVTLWWAAYWIGSSLPAVGMVATLRATLGPALDQARAGVPTAPTVDVARLHETAALWNTWGAVLLTVAAGCAVHFVLHISRCQDERLELGSSGPLRRPSSHLHGT
jgi:hypothetical protein